MKKIAIILLLLSSVSASAQVSGISARAFPQQIPVSRLPTANGTQGVRIVTDALSSSSCTIGGGSVKLICFDNGSWVVVGLGIEGADGQAATIQVGSVTTSSPGSSAEVENSGTETEAIFDFTIPRGDTGAQGLQGLQGIQGIQGVQGVQGADGTNGSDGIPRTIQDEASDLTQRLKINFTGAGVTCTDNSGQSRTDCTIPGSSVGPDLDIPGTLSFGHPGNGSYPNLRESGNELTIGARRLYAYEFYACPGADCTSDAWRYSQGGITGASASSSNFSISGTGSTGHIVIGPSGGAKMLRIPPSVNPPFSCGSADSEGAIYTDSSHALCFCDGTVWVNLTPTSGGSCS